MRENISDAVSRLNKVWDEKFSEMAQYYLRAYLWSWCLAFKNEAFKHEEEIRIVIDIPIEDISWATQPTKLDEIKIMYRNHHGLFTSFFYMYFEEYTLDSITIGPFSNSEQDKNIQEENIYSFLRKTGFNIGRGRVTCSDIPIRF